MRRAKGLGPWHYGWKADKPDHRDFKYSAIMPGIVIPESVDLRPKDTPIFNQLNLGSCTGNALGGHFDFIHPGYNSSRLFIYYNERVMEGDVDQDGGAEIRDGISSLNTQGVCSEADWPYDIVKFADKPSDECYVAAQAEKIVSYHRITGLVEMLACLAEGFPFVFGFTVYEGFESEEVTKTGILNMPGPDEQVLGGHAVMAVGYDKASARLIVRNSWGAEWGDKGYFTLPFEYAEKLASDFWTIRK